MAWPTTTEPAANFEAIKGMGEGAPDGTTEALLQELRDHIITLQNQVGIASADYRKRMVKSQIFDLDNGNGTTVDECVARFPFAVTIRAARTVYDDATTGTVAAGTVSVGTTVGGVDVVAATAYENTKAVGSTTALAVITTADVNKFAANAPIFVRHTGVAATQAGKAHVELDYTID